MYFNSKCAFYCAFIKNISCLGTWYHAFKPGYLKKIINLPCHSLGLTDSRRLMTVISCLYVCQELEQVDELVVPILPRLHLSAEKLDAQGAFLMDAGDHMMLLVGRAISANFCQNVLGVPSFVAIPDDMVSRHWTFALVTVCLWSKPEIRPKSVIFHFFLREITWIHYSFWKPAKLSLKRAFV